MPLQLTHSPLQEPFYTLEMPIRFSLFESHVDASAAELGVGIAQAAGGGGGR